MNLNAAFVKVSKVELLFSLALNTISPLVFAFAPAPINVKAEVLEVAFPTIIGFCELPLPLPKAIEPSVWLVISIEDVEPVLISRFAVGEVVPIPTLPFLFISKRELLYLANLYAVEVKVAKSVLSVYITSKNISILEAGESGVAAITDNPTLLLLLPVIAGTAVPPLLLLKLIVPLG